MVSTFPDYPFASHFLDRKGLRLHFLDEGKGPPMVMVHGNPSWSFLYRRLVSAFRDTHRVIVPDHIGCGLSDKPGDDRYDYRLRSRIDDLEALLADRGIDRDITLVVHDWGGPIGFGFAARHPERIRRLVIFNTAAFGLPAGKPFPWPLWLFRNSWLGEWANRAGNAFARITALTSTAAPLPPEVYRAFVGPYDSWDTRIATIRFVQDIPLTPADPSWPDLQAATAGLERFRDTPALVCWGRRDFIFDRAFFLEWRRRLPHAEMHSFRQAGHYLLEEVHAEVIALMRDFLARHP
ncbi:MAG: alpha/beta fold hydrolase [Candidatus Riflebacteria bacterium]|nr:alpha/beta fold hydrolase [Candidatus Riflebacteria bacterium]